MNVNKTRILLSTCRQRCTTCIIILNLIINICPYNKTVIDFHGGKYRVILTEVLLTKTNFAVALIQ